MFKHYRFLTAAEEGPTDEELLAQFPQETIDNYKNNKGGK